MLESVFSHYVAVAVVVAISISVSVAIVVWRGDRKRNFPLSEALSALEQEDPTPIFFADYDFFLSAPYKTPGDFKAFWAHMAVQDKVALLVGDGKNNPGIKKWSEKAGSGTS